MDKGQRKNDQEIFRDKIFIKIVIKCFAQKGKNELTNEFLACARTRCQLSVLKLLFTKIYDQKIA